jgi:hypothetical protein
MMNTLTFVALIALWEAAVVWIAYQMGVQNGWLQGWEDRRASK